MLKFDKNDLADLEENSKSKLILVENNYRGKTFKQDFRDKTLNKSKLRIVKGDKNV